MRSGTVDLWRPWHRRRPDYGPAVRVTAYAQTAARVSASAPTDAERQSDSSSGILPDYHSGKAERAGFQTGSSDRTGKYLE